MMVQRKRLACLALLLCFITVLVGCGANAKKNENWAYIVRDCRNPYWEAVINAIEAELPEGKELVVFDSIGDIENETNNVNKVMAEGYQKVFVSAVSQTESTNNVQSLILDGVTVVLVDSMVNGCDEVYQVQSDRFSNGYQSMTVLLENLPENAEVMVMNLENTEQMMEGVQAALDEHPGITVMDAFLQKISNSNDALEQFQSTMEEKPGIQGIWCVNGLMGEGIVNYIISNGLEEKVLVSEGRSYPNTPNELKRGCPLASIAEDPSAFGKAAGELMKQIEEDTVEKGATVLIPGILVTRDNMEKYLDLSY